MPERRGDWIQGFSGGRFWPLDPRPEDVKIEDIAHALANLCRFCGHSRAFYSVGQHSVLASLNAPPESALAALLHDAAEAYLGDIARPWKRFLSVNAGTGDAVYHRLKDMEYRLLDVILAAMGCPPRSDRAVWEPVEEIDMRMLATEARDLMSPLVDEWSNTFQKSPCAARYAYNPYPEAIECWSPVLTKAAFLARYEALTIQIKGQA